MKLSYIIQSLTALAACIFVLNGCKKYNQDLTWKVNTNVYSSPVLLRFLNSDPAATDEPKNFTVTVSGKDAGKVVMSSGGTEFKAVNGLLPVSLVNGVVPTPQNPVIFNVYADIPGYAPVSQAIILTDTAPQVRSVFAVSYNSPVKGTAALQRQTNLNGGTSGAVDFVTQTNASMSERTIISIQDGTQMLDGNGNVINASSLQTKIIHFGTGTTSSLESFPGGLTAPDAIGQDGKAIPRGVTFVTGGLVSIRMQAGGTDVKKFSKPLNVNMEVNSNVVNPGTNRPVALGDSIPVWSLNEQTGQWKWESMGVVALDGNGKMSVQFQAAHLSCWNLDWWWECFGSYQTCDNPLKVIVHAGGILCGGNYEVTLETTANQYLGALHGTELYDGFECTFANTPNIANAKIVITNNATGKIEVESILFTPCTQGVIEVTLGVPPVPDVVDINLIVVGKCRNVNTEALINGWFYFYLPGAGPLGDRTLIYVENGAARLKLLNGAAYTVETCYNLQDYLANGLFNKNNFTFTPVELGQYKLVATGVFEATTNTLDVNVNVEMVCE